MAIRLLLFGCVLSSLAGCGTMANMQGKNLPALDAGGQYEPRPFGGVRNDLRWTYHGNGLILGIIDLPFSIVGDVVTLPKVLFGTTPKPSEPPAEAEEKQ